MSVKSDNFKRISENRIKKINDMISKLHNLNNPSFYEFTDKQIEEMFNEIQDELDKQRIIFLKEKNRIRRRTKL